jgi:hypothetical protein
MANDNDHFQRARLGRGQKHARKIASQHLQDLTSRQEHGTQDLPHKTLDKKKKSTSLPFLRRHRDRFKRREQGPRKETLLSPPLHRPLACLGGSSICTSRSLRFAASSIIQAPLSSPSVPDLTPHLLLLPSELPSSFLCFFPSLLLL